MPNRPARKAGFLVVDCYLDQIGGAKNVVPFFPNSEVLRAAHEELPPVLEADAIIITGSAASVLDAPEWALCLEERVARAAERNTPILGLCFGHQVLARAVFGERAVRRAPRPELGWTTIERRGDDALFGGVEHEFECFVSHSDEVDPELDGFRAGARILASTEDCAVEAFRVNERPLWGVQFHAEMGLAESRELVTSRLGRSSEEARRRLMGASATPDLVRSLFDNFRKQVDSGV